MTSRSGATARSSSRVVLSARSAMTASGPLMRTRGGTVRVAVAVTRTASHAPGTASAARAVGIAGPEIRVDRALSVAHRAQLGATRADSDDLREDRYGDLARRIGSDVEPDGRVDRCERV